MIWNIHSEINGYKYVQIEASQHIHSYQSLSFAQTNNIVNTSSQMTFYSFETLSSLFTSPDFLFHLQQLNSDGSENNVTYQWIGPHFLAFIRYATKLCLLNKYKHKGLNNFLSRLDDWDLHRIKDGETKHYKKILEIILSFMPRISVLFTIQQHHTNVLTRFIDFLVDTIEELLNCGTDSSVIVSNEVKVLLNELKFLFSFLVDTVRCNKKKQNKNILVEIEVVSNEAGLFLHSFFFTTDLVTVTQMDLALSVLLERIENVKVKIKDHCIAIAASKKLSSGIGSLKVEESPSEVSSQDKSIPIVDEIVVGFENATTQIVGQLLRGPNYRQIISIVGMPGLGKTTLAKKVYNDSRVRDHFDKLSWCVVSQSYKKRKLLLDILSSISNLNRDKILEMADSNLSEHLYKSLKGRRYIIVMDDIWAENAWDEMKMLFPDDSNGSRVVFTSRLRNLASEISHVIMEPRPLSPRNCWDLLKQKVFKNEDCPPQDLEDIGKKIAKNCHGLPLLVVVIASVLSNMEKTISSWERVATSMSSYITGKVDDYLSILKLSYENLPSHLQPCFLYLIAFEEDEEIPVRKLLLLWIAEGFVEKKEHKTLEDVAEEYLIELINRSLLQVACKRSDNGVKACTLHDLILEMCWKIAEEEKFMFQHQFLISKHRHRLCMDQSHHVSETLSILYNFEKIRILDSSSKRTQSEVLGIKIMPELRFLKIYSLESSIGKLQNLEFLHVEVIDYIPTYLLNMPKLRHLRVGRPSWNFVYFSNDCDTSEINSLQTLSFINFKNSKDEKILKCLPNLRSLKCEYTDNYIANLNFLTQLESLKMTYCYGLSNSHSCIKFPKNIKRLSLSKVHLSLKNMSIIGTLPNLEILKLEEHSLGVDIWNTKDDEFQKLKFLKIKSLGLKEWNSSSDHFPELERLVLKNCYYLEMIPSEFSNIPTLQKIVVDYCGRNVESSALEIRDGQRDNGNEEFDVTVYRFFK